ncbi:hypothetical protein ACHHYP_00942 [Achlya hypogyna]|uniref:MSP domain-containing protein n=1 Tax=Achlya hypogyna TaxID=1202772 RepID=A0A1V9Z9U6_ACHHY|nr:hypothetical protein ACHHYP_00942 [Achlya hypogyna]
MTTTTEDMMMDYRQRFGKLEKERKDLNRDTMDFGLEEPVSPVRGDASSKHMDLFLSDSDDELAGTNLFGQIPRDYSTPSGKRNLMDDSAFANSLLDSPQMPKATPSFEPSAIPTHNRDSLEAYFAPQSNLAAQASQITCSQDATDLDKEHFEDAATFMSRQEALMRPPTMQPELASENTTWTDTSGLRSSPDDFFAERSRNLSNVEFGDTPIPRKDSTVGLLGTQSRVTKSDFSYIDFSTPAPQVQTTTVASTTPSQATQLPKAQTVSGSNEAAYSSQTGIASKLFIPSTLSPPQQQAAQPLYHTTWTPTPSTESHQPVAPPGIEAPFLDLSISQSTPVKDLVPRRQTPPVENDQPLSISTYLQRSLAQYANRPNVSSMQINIDDEPLKVVSDAVQAALSLTTQERDSAQWKEPIHPSHVIHSSLDAVAAVQAMIEATGHMQASVSEVMRLRAHAKQAVEAAVVSEAMAIADYQQQCRALPPRIRAGSQQYERSAIDNITAELTSVVQEPTQPILPPPRRSSRVSLVGAHTARVATGKGGGVDPRTQLPGHQSSATEQATPFQCSNQRTDTVVSKCALPMQDPEVLSPATVRIPAQPRDLGLSPIHFERSGVSEADLRRPPSPRDCISGERTTAEEENRQRLHALLGTKSQTEPQSPPQNQGYAPPLPSMSHSRAQPHTQQSLTGEQSQALRNTRSNKRDKTPGAERSFEAHEAFGSKPNLRIDTSAPYGGSSGIQKPASTKMHRDDLQTTFRDVEHQDKTERYSIQQHADRTNPPGHELTYKEVPISPPPTPYTKALDRPKLCKRFLCTLGGEISETFVFRNTSAQYARICASIVPLSRGCNQFRIVPTVLEMPPHASDHFVIRFIASQVGAVSGIFQFRSMSGDPRATPYEIIVDAHVKESATPPRPPARIVQEAAEEGVMEVTESAVDVDPTFLRLMAQNDAKVFDVINYSERDVPFSISCPYPNLSVVPTQGVVQPQSKFTVAVHCVATAVTPVPPMKKPWTGSFTITLNNSLTREIIVVLDAPSRSPATQMHAQSYPKSSQLSQSSAASSTRTKKRSKRGLFFQADNMDCGATPLNTSQCVPVRICNGAKEPMTVFVQTLGRPFSCAYSTLTLRPRSYVEVPVVFTPEKPGEASVPMVVYTNTDKAILMLHGRTTTQA